MSLINYPIHHAILLAENIKLIEENLKFKEQIAVLQLDQKEHKHIHGIFLTKNYSTIDLRNSNIKRNKSKFSVRY